MGSESSLDRSKQKLRAPCAMLSNDSVERHLRTGPASRLSRGPHKSTQDRESPTTPTPSSRKTQNETTRSSPWSPVPAELRQPMHINFGAPPTHPWASLCSHSCRSCMPDPSAAHPAPPHSSPIGIAPNVTPDVTCRIDVKRIGPGEQKHEIKGGKPSSTASPSSCPAYRLHSQGLLQGLGYRAGLRHTVNGCAQQFSDSFIHGLPCADPVLPIRCPCTAPVLILCCPYPAPCLSCAAPVCCRCAYSVLS